MCSDLYEFLQWCNAYVLHEFPHIEIKSYERKAEHASYVEGICKASTGRFTTSRSFLTGKLFGALTDWAVWLAREAHRPFACCGTAPDVIVFSSVYCSRTPARCPSVFASL